MTDQPRTYYGGEPPGAQTHGEIEGGLYAGPIPPDGPWACPACKVEQTGQIADGCQACGSGTQKAYKAAVPEGPPRRVPAALVQADAAAAMGRLKGPLGPFPITYTPIDDIYRIAEIWAEAHPGASLAEAFVAGYLLATQGAQAQTMTAPPVTADVAALAPEGKPRRTIVAALRYFRDQVLAQAAEEVASGEWCSIEEVDHMIQQFDRDDVELTLAKVTND